MTFIIVRNSVHHLESLTHGNERVVIKILWTHGFCSKGYTFTRLLMDKSTSFIYFDASIDSSRTKIGASRCPAKRKAKVTFMARVKMKHLWSCSVLVKQVIIMPRFYRRSALIQCCGGAGTRGSAVSTKEIILLLYSGRQRGYRQNLYWQAETFVSGRVSYRLYMSSFACSQHTVPHTHTHTHTVTHTHAHTPTPTHTRTLCNSDYKNWLEKDR